MVSSKHPISTMGYSQEQHLFIYADLPDITLVIAYAGTGKSFTLKAYSKEHPTTRFLYFVYNKSMGIDAKRSFKELGNVTITTFHGLSFQKVGIFYVGRLEKKETLRSSDLTWFFSSQSDRELREVCADALLKTLKDFLVSSESMKEYLIKHQKRSALAHIHDHEVLFMALSKLPDLWRELTRYRFSDLIDFFLFGVHKDLKEGYKKATWTLLKHFYTSSLSVAEYVQKYSSSQSIGRIKDPKAIAHILGKMKRGAQRITRLRDWDTVMGCRTLTLALKKGDEGRIPLPFEHDVYLKLYQLSRPNLSSFPTILVDEAQDISHVMLDIVLRQKQSKKIFVGDTFQSIYSWRGAVNSLEYIKERMNPRIFYLSQSFRCPPKVAWLANRIIQLAGAEKPFVGVATPAPITKQKTYIGRTNSGIFEHCVANIDKKIYFVGGIKSYHLSDILDIQNLISKKRDYIRNKYIASFPDYRTFLAHIKKSEDVAMIGMAGIVVRYMKQNVYSLVKGLKSAATTDINEADLVVTSYHKSKGLEWSCCELLEDSPFCNPDKYSMLTEAERLEELRLLYVSVTRAMSTIEVPRAILEYLEIEEREMPSYLRKSSSIQAQKTHQELPNIDTLLASSAPMEIDYSSYPPIELGACKFCGNETIKRHDLYYCQSCDFEIKRSAIERFYSIFHADFSQEDECRAIRYMMSNEGHHAKGFVNKEGRRFDPNLTFTKDDKYGWTLTFAKQRKTPRKKR